MGYEILALLSWKHYLMIILYVLVSCQAQFTCNTENMTHGELFESKSGEFYTAQPIETYPTSTGRKCIMKFSAGLKRSSMNILEESNSNVTCQMFEIKANDDGEDGFLIKDNRSTYYEKSQDVRYTKASGSVIEVETRDEKPGIVYFKQPTGCYRIKLKHVTGFVICNPNKLPSHFGCYQRDPGEASSIHLVKDFRGDTVIERDEFTDFEDDGRTTSYIATSRCFYFIQDSMYTFWYRDDLFDIYEANNSGKTTFEFLVEPCNS